MLIQRLYDMPEGWEGERDSQGNLLNRPPVKGLHLIHTGFRPEQNFARRFIDAGLQEGWLSLGGGKIIIHTVEVDLEYTILKTPGAYCCHCDAKLDDDPSGESGQRHVRANHSGEHSPDRNNPLGHRVTNAYECRLEEGQHARWQVPSYATVSHDRWKERQHTSNGTGGETVVLTRQEQEHEQGEGEGERRTGQQPQSRR